MVQKLHERSCMRTHIVISSKRTGKRQKKRIVNRNADAFSDEQKSKIIRRMMIMRKFKEELKTWFEDAVKFYGELAEINARYGRM